MLLLICIIAESIEISTVPISGPSPPALIRTKATFNPETKEIIIFGGQDATTLKFINTLYTFNVESLIWGEITSQTYESPPGLASAEIFLTADKKILVFFGTMKSAISSNVYSFTLTTKKWAVETLKGDYIDGRVNYACNDYYYKGIRYLAIFGGLTSDGIDNNLYLIEFSNLNVRRISNDDYFLGKAFGKTLVYYNENLYIYGASLNNNYENSTSTMDVFNLETEKWDKIQFSANYPNARIAHLANVYNNSMYIFFGNNIENSSIYNDVWSYNFISSKWSTLSNFSHQDLCASIQINSKVYILFGRLGFQGVNSISYFDLSNNILENNLIIENRIFPPKRRNHCMTKFNDKIYIFGGISEDGSYLNDLWKFYNSSQKWELVTPSGTVPLGRSSFGCCADAGTGFLIYGGNSDNGILGDLYFHDFALNFWSKIEFTGLMPGQRAGLCFCSIPLYAFIIGGSLGSEVYKDIWLLDYTKWISIKVAELPIGLINAKCWNELINGVHHVYVMSGTSIHFDANQYFFHVTINQTNGVYTSSVDKIKNDIITISESALILSGDTAMLVLGSVWNNFLKPVILSYNYKTREIYTENTGSLALFGHSAVHLGDSIYIFGGGFSYDNVKFVESTSNIMYKIKSESEQFKNRCSHGYEKIGDLCVPCQKGSYYDGSNCTLCPVGTFNTYLGAYGVSTCIPCDYGFYTNKEGSTFCYECPSYSLCPIGSSSMLNYSSHPNYQKNKIHQPKFFYGKTSMISNIVEVLWIYSIILTLICIIAIFKISVLWNSVEKIDLFVSNHEQKINVPVIYRKTKIGGIFSIIYIVVTSIIIAGSFIAYKLDNITEIKGLVPLVTVEESISAQSFLIDALFLTYGGSCQEELNHVKLISIIETNIDYVDQNIKLQNKSGDCLVSLIYTRISFSDSATITIKFNELTARSTSIYVNISSSSSIPSEPSNISVILVPPDFKQVFIGFQPSIIPLSLIPSVFYSQDNKWPSMLTGYHVTSGGNVVIGETATQKTITSKALLLLQLKFTIDNSALITKRNINNSWFIFFGGLFGSIFGIFSAFSSLLGVSENWVNKIVRKYQKFGFSRKVMNKRDTLKNNFIMRYYESSFNKYAKVVPYTDNDI